MDGGGWASYRNSLAHGERLSRCSASTVIFSGAYLLEKARGFVIVRNVIQFLALLPLAVPGLVLGLGYIFFFNNPANPLHFIYGTMAILVLCTVAHFYSVAHLTSVTALKQIDPEFETVGASLRVPFYTTFAKVTLPVSLPALLDIAIYLFVNAMTTVSAVVFLYSPSTTLGRGRRAQYGRCRRCRAGGGDGDDDLRDRGRAAHRLLPFDATATAQGSSLAPALAETSARRSTITPARLPNGA